MAKKQTKKSGKKPVKKPSVKKATRKKIAKTSKATLHKVPHKVAAHAKPHLSREARNWGMYCHLAAFAGFIIPFGNIIGPLVAWLMKREEIPFVNKQGKESLNFQISMTIYFFVALLLTFIIIGFVLIPALIIAQVIFIIIASIKAQEGGYYHYPATIRFFK